MEEENLEKTNKKIPVNVFLLIETIKMQIIVIVIYVLPLQLELEDTRYV